MKVETDEPGIHGWGECSLPGKTHGVQGAIRDLEKLVLGADPLNTERAWQRMYRHGYWRGGPIQTSALSGIDMALWDIRGIKFGLVFPEPLGVPAEGSYSALKPAARFTRLDRVPLALGGHTDLSCYPARKGYDDISHL